MSSSTLNTPYLQECILRWQAGERQAAEELLLKVQQSFQHLVERLFQGFPHLHAHLESSDVYQGAVQRLLHTLLQYTPRSSAHFLALLAVHIRRELLDLTRHFATVQRHQRALPVDLIDARVPATEDLELWTRWHEAIGQLPDEERAVVDLVFYQGCTQVQVAELLSLSERTVRRRWQSACLHLHQMLNGQFPVAGS